MDLNGKILIQVTIISATVGKNPLEEMESPHSQQESKMQYMGAMYCKMYCQK